MNMLRQFPNTECRAIHTLFCYTPTKKILLSFKESYRHRECYPLATYPTPRTVRIQRRPLSLPIFSRMYRIYTSTIFVSPT